MGEISLHPIGKPSGPGVVPSCYAENLWTVYPESRGTTSGWYGNRLKSGIRQICIYLLNYWLIAFGLRIELTFWLLRFLPVILFKVSYHFFDPVPCFLFPWRMAGIRFGFGRWGYWYVLVGRVQLLPLCAYSFSYRCVQGDSLVLHCASSTGHKYQFNWWTKKRGAMVFSSDRSTVTYIFLHNFSIQIIPL